MFSLAPSAPEVTVVGGDGAVVIWDIPSMPNGIIINYELKFTAPKESITMLVDTEDLYYVPSLSDVPQANGSMVTVEVGDFTYIFWEWNFLTHTYRCKSINNISVAFVKSKG